MTTTTQQPAPLVLGDETWGDRFYRAYRRARVRWGKAMILENLAAEVSRLKGITDSTIIRYAATDRDEPKADDSRVNVYLTLVAMGYDPAEFGFTEENTPGIRVFVASGLLAELHPSNWVHRYADQPDQPEPDEKPKAKRARKPAASRPRARMPRSTWMSRPAGQKPGTTGPGRKSGSAKAA